MSCRQKGTVQDLTQISDEALQQRSQHGEYAASAELIVRYTPSVLYYAERYCYLGLEKEDLMQEGMIALLSAIRTYREDGGASFRTYASRCISNGLAKVAAYSSGHGISPGADHSAGWQAGEVSAPSRDEPEEVVIRQEQSLDRSHRMRSELSDYERPVPQLLLDGCSYAQIAGRLGRTVKLVDRVLGRARQAAPGADRSGLNCFLFLSS